MSDIEIVSDPEIMGGQPCFKGTRIPIRIAAITQREWVLEHYPTLTDAHIDAAKAYAWPVVREPEPRVDDLTIWCRCGEEAGMVGRPWDDGFTWLTDNRYQCRLCNRAYDLRITITEVAP